MIQERKLIALGRRGNLVNDFWDNSKILTYNPFKCCIFEGWKVATKCLKNIKFGNHAEKRTQPPRASRVV